MSSACGPRIGHNCSLRTCDFSISSITPAGAHTGALEPPRLGGHNYLNIHLWDQTSLYKQHLPPEAGMPQRKRLCF